LPFVRLEFLKQVANIEDIPLLQEWFGFCLLPDYRFHKVLWIHGEGRNGKGVFDRTIQGIVGKNNVSSLGLEELDGSHRFALSQLIGKLYNTCSEPTTNRIFRTEIFQKVSGGDLIKAELKGKNDRLDYVNCAKLTIIGNKFPKIDSPTTAFKDRMIFVKFPNFFSDKDRIVNLENVWLDDSEQKSSILNWALVGLHRLISQNGFTQTKTQKETEIEFNRVSNPPDAFIMERGVICKTLVTTRAANLEAYQEYCEGIGVIADAKALTQAMNKLAPKVKDGWINKPKKERVWLGFGLKSDEQQNENLPQLPQLPQQKILSESYKESKSNYLEDKTRVVSVASVVNPEQLKVVAEESGLRHLEVNQGFEKSALGEIHYHRIPPNEPHICQCPSCSGEGVREADFETVDSEDKPLFVCESCLKALEPKVRESGMELVEDLPHSPLKKHIEETERLESLKQELEMPDFENKCEPPEEES